MTFLIRKTNCRKSLRTTGLFKYFGSHLILCLLIFPTMNCGWELSTSTAYKEPKRSKAISFIILKKLTTSYRRKLCESSAHSSQPVMHMPLWFNGFPSRPWNISYTQVERYIRNFQMLFISGCTFLTKNTDICSYYFLSKPIKLPYSIFFRWFDLWFVKQWTNISMRNIPSFHRFVIIFKIYVFNMKNLIIFKLVTVLMKITRLREIGCITDIGLFFLL